MELIAKYILVKKKRDDPWLTRYLEKDIKMKPHHRKLIDMMEGRILGPLPTLNDGRHARQSGKIDIHFAQQIARLNALPDPAGDFREYMNQVGREMARRKEQRIFESFNMISFENGSRIESMPSRDAIRGSRSSGVFLREYLADWGDRDGDVYPVPTNSR